MATKWKRWSILVSLIAAFFMFSLALTSCGLAETASSGLANSAGSGNGPGSGKWKPILPENQRQARRLHTILQALASDSTELATEYDRLYDGCFDGDGKLLPDVNGEECHSKATELTDTLQDHFRDFAVGSDNYNTWAQEGEKEDPPPKAPETPKEPKNPPKTEDPGDDDDDDGPIWRCLTCINRIDLEYMYAPFRAELN